MMKKFLREVVIKTGFARSHAKALDPDQVSDYIIAKGLRRLIIVLRHNIKDFLLIGVGITSATFGLKGFILPNQFIDGGATGISLLLHTLFEIPFALLILLVNIPFVFLAHQVAGKEFAIKTIIAIAGLAIALTLVEFPDITNDKLLVAIFGGFFLGAGIGFAVRGGAVIDGTEVLAISISRKVGATMGDIITIINILIFSAAAYFLSVDTALYSMVTYIAASKSLDFIAEGIEEYIGVTIVSNHCDEIKDMIFYKLGRGVTIYNGKRGFGKRGQNKDMDIIYTVITRLEINKMYTELEKIEPSAFVVMTSVKDTKGGMIKKRPLKHH